MCGWEADGFDWGIVSSGGLLYWRCWIFGFCYLELVTHEAAKIQIIIIIIIIIIAVVSSSSSSSSSSSGGGAWPTTELRFVISSTSYSGGTGLEFRSAHLLLWPRDLGFFWEHLGKCWDSTLK